MTNIVIITSGIIILVFITVIFMLIKTPKKRKDSAIDYTAALNYLLAGDKQKAYDKLKEAVRHDTSNVDAYLKIGDLLRDSGYIERAIKVHKGLTVRNNLSTYERIEILKSLVKDYRIGKRFDKALEICGQLQEITRQEQWVQELKLDVLEERDDWDSAFDARKQLLRQQGINDDPLLALYKVQAGLAYVKEEREHDARIKYREAIKIHNQCAPAYLYLSDSYIREERLSDALDELTKFLEAVPKLAYLAFDRVQNILFEKGDFGEVESIYQKLLQRNPDIAHIRFALADIYERKGELQAAINLCKKELEQNPDSEIAKKYLVKYYARTGQNDDALEIALSLFEDSLQSAELFTCRVCQNTDDQPHWRCPKCQEWNTYVN
ncbi:tetratricopeptide repeat protein [candidate division KSB1 bacterium]|nr:tetratricopeptide repeat protein [candidate division KSB1 bacterium]